jgi:hypothetical protein
MISLAFVNNSNQEPIIHSLLYRYESQVNDAIDEINNAFFEYHLLENKDEFEEFFTEAEDNKKPEEKPAENKPKEKKDGIIKTIGKAVIKLFKAFFEFINNLISKITSIGIEGKSTMKKAEEAIKRHPELKDKILEGVSSGDLDLKDVDNLRQLDDAVDDMLKRARKATDQQTLSDKFDEKYDKLVKAGKIAAGALAAYEAITKLPKLFNEIHKVAADSKARAAKQQAELEQLGKDNNWIADNEGVFNTLLKTTKIKNNTITKYLNGKMNTMDKIMTKLANLADSSAIGKKMAEDKAYRDEVQAIKNDRPESIKALKAEIDDINKQHAKDVDAVNKQLEKAKNIIGGLKNKANYSARSRQEALKQVKDLTARIDELIQDKRDLLDKANASAAEKDAALRELKNKKAKVKNLLQQLSLYTDVSPHDMNNP